MRGRGGQREGQGNLEAGWEAVPGWPGSYAVPPAGHGPSHRDTRTPGRARWPPPWGRPLPLRPLGLLPLARPVGCPSPRGRPRPRARRRRTW